MQETVSAAARWVAGQVEPELRARLRARYGPGWLEAVNDRRRAEGRAPGRSLRDHRFCLAVFAYDPATEGWVDDQLRRQARVLIGLANSAAHDEVTDGDVSRVAEIVALFSDHVGVSPPSTFLPGDGPPSGVVDPRADELGHEGSTGGGVGASIPQESSRDGGGPDDDVTGEAAGGSGARWRRPGRRAASPDRVASRAGLRVERMVRLRVGPGRGRWGWLPSNAKPVGAVLAAVLALACAGVLVSAHGVAALLALPFIVVLAVVLAALALYLLLWAVAVGGLAWAAYLFAHGESLGAVVFLWIGVIAGVALVWLHEEVLS